MTRLLSVLLVVSSLVFVSCSSDDAKKKGDSIVSDAGADGDFTMELNGDSDSNTAGPISTVYFGFDSSKVGSSAREILNKNAEYLKAIKSVDIRVEGHADERGGIQYNIALGERRARAIKDYLVALGIDEGRIDIVTYGKERPVSFGHDEDSWGKNRRGNFVITAK